MAKAAVVEVTKVRVPADQWIARLASVLKTVDEMDDDERCAAFSFLRSRYRNQWPSDSY